MSELVITGTVTETLTVESGVSKTSGKEWKKGYFVIETQDQYPKKIRIALFGDDKINNFGPVIQPGVLVNVNIDIESRSYQTRDGKTGWATDINGWKVVDAMAAAQQQYQQANAPVFANQPIPTAAPQPGFAQPAQQQPAFPAMPANGNPQQAWAPTPQGMQQYQQQYPTSQQGQPIQQPGAPAAPAGQTSDLPF